MDWLAWHSERVRRQIGRRLDATFRIRPLDLNALAIAIFSPGIEITVSNARFTWQSALTRALIGTLGGFVTAISFMIGTASALAAAGWMQRADAAVAASMLAFLVWMTAVLTAFGAASVQRAAGWVLGSATGFALLGWVCLHSAQTA